MDATARRVRAERDRRRLPPAMRRTRWVRRIVGVIATAAFVAVGADSARLIVNRAHAAKPSATLIGAPPAAAQARHPRRHHRRVRHGA